MLHIMAHTPFYTVYYIEFSHFRKTVLKLALDFFAILSYHGAK